MYGTVKMISLDTGTKGLLGTPHYLIIVNGKHHTRRETKTSSCCGRHVKKRKEFHLTDAHKGRSHLTKHRSSGIRINVHA